MYFEDLEEGQILTSRTRVMTPTDIESFTSMSWAVNPIFLSDEAARSAGLAGRVAPGALVVSYAVGLLYQLGLFDHIVAMTELSSRFTSPISPGDAMQVECRVDSKREIDERRGLVRLTATCKNLTKNKDAASLNLTLLYRRRGQSR